MNLKTLYAQLKDQHEKIGATLVVLRPYITNNGTDIMEAAAAALAAHAETPRAKRGPKPRLPGSPPRHAPFGRLADGKPRKRAKQTMRELPEVKVPDGLSTKGLELRPAILEVLKHYRKPATGKEVTALMLGSGYESPYRGPLTTIVATVMPRYTKEWGIKKTAKGWTLRK